MRRRIYLLLVLLATLSAGATHAEAKTCNSHRCATKLTVSPGETVRYTTPRMAREASAVRIRVNGRAAYYELVPRTGGCRGYAYRLGVVISLSDCGRGRRYIRVKVTNTSGSRRVVRFGYRA